MISEDSDQAARMRSLICVFAGRTSLIEVFCHALFNLLYCDVFFSDETEDPIRTNRVPVILS